MRTTHSGVLVLFCVAACSAPRELISEPSNPVFSSNGKLKTAPERTELPPCGRGAEPPFGTPMFNSRKACVPPTLPRYVSKYSTIGHKILQLESRGCGASDSALMLLDSLIEQSKKIDFGAKSATNRDQLLRLNTGIARMLTKNGFALHIPVSTLTSSLSVNSTKPNNRYLFDCDTGSFIYMSIAEYHGITASLVEISLPSGAGHNYLQMKKGDMIINWDVNAQTECMTPQNLPSYEGVPMKLNEVKSYVLRVSGMAKKARADYKGARADYDKALTLTPASPSVLNGIAWLTATTIQLQSKNSLEEARHLISVALNAQRIPGFLDTQACVYAAIGDFSKAEASIKEAIAADKSAEYESRLVLFRNSKTCVGLN